MTLSDPKFLGTWRIDRWNATSPSITMSLVERKEELEAKVPSVLFSFSDYPDMDIDIEGDVIPAAIGIVKGATAYLIDETAKKFKVVGHSLVSMDGFFNQDRDAFSPDSIDLVNGEFVYTGWNETDQLYVDITATDENPVDAIGVLLTDSVKGANLPLSRLDTTSTGKGFGANGARVGYIYGMEVQSGDEAIEFPIGLYMQESKKVEEWIQEVSSVCFAIVYVDGAGLYQVKKWKPVPSEGLTEITDNESTQILTLDTNATKPITRAVARYNRQHGFDGSSVNVYEDEELRQLRGLSAHTTLDMEIPISTRFGAKLWAEKSVYTRGRPRRNIKINVTQQYMELEPGDFVRLKSSRRDIDEVFEVLEITTEPGSLKVYLVLTDIRGWRNAVGFWASDAPSFPASLGGGAIASWDNTWTDAQKKWIKENIGYWHDADGYADVTNDPQDSFRTSKWW